MRASEYEEIKTVIDIAPETSVAEHVARAAAVLTGEAVG